MEQNEWEVLLEALATGDLSRAIRNQEQRGQHDLNVYDVLPKQGNREQLEALGVIFGEDVDELFIKAKLPDGWTKRPTSHDMWTELVDDKGRARANIFYKAVFYDRNAFIGLICRYSYHVEPVTGYGDNYDPKANYVGVVKDRDLVIWKSMVSIPNDDWTGRDALKADAKAWIDNNFPDWKNPLAYWD